ncbi:MAG: hypothetical protein R6U00_02260, partial [Prochlorococcaceae cyanobacterium]
YQRLRETIAERMRMSHIDQPLMLMELLGRHTQDVARRILVSGWWARFTFNGITRCEQGSYALVGGEELSDVERDQLLELCRQRLDQVPGAHPHQRALEVDHVVPKKPRRHRRPQQPAGPLLPLQRLQARGRLRVLRTRGQSPGAALSP